MLHGTSNKAVRLPVQNGTCIHSPYFAKEHLWWISFSFLTCLPSSECLTHSLTNSIFLIVLHAVLDNLCVCLVTHSLLPFSQASLQAQTARVYELESENQGLACEVEGARREVENVRKEAEQGKREALEQ